MSISRMVFIPLVFVLCVFIFLLSMDEAMLCLPVHYAQSQRDEWINSKLKTLSIQNRGCMYIEHMYRQ